MKEQLNYMVCKLCLGWMQIHPENEDFRKCPTCGFCKRIKEKKMFITKEELLKGRDKTYPNDYTQEVSDNLDELLPVINQVRDAYGIPMTVTSGWRPPSLNAITPGAANHSLHEQGLAVDILDTDGKLMEWVLENLQLMKDLGIYLEDFRYTPNWVHFGIRSPKSGHRIFVPSSAPPKDPNRWDGAYNHSFD